MLAGIGSIQALAPPQMIEAGVAGDPGQPIVEPLGVLAGIETVEHPDEYVLGEVKGLVLLAHVAVGDGAYASLMVSHEHLPGEFIALLTSFQDLRRVHGVVAVPSVG